MTDQFGKRISIEEVEEGKTFMPKFDEKGLIPVITLEAVSYTHLTLPTILLV